MPVYEFKCPDCGYRESATLPMKLYDSFIKELQEQECPFCNTKNLIRVYNVQIRSAEDVHERTMKARFSKRNKQLEAMPKPKQERFKKFMYKYGVKKTW